MNNVISLPKRASDESPAAPNTTARTFDFTFYLGIALTVILPQVVFWYYFGVLVVVILAICTLTGTGAGLRAYVNPSDQITSCVPGSSQQAIANPDAKLRLAA